MMVFQCMMDIYSDFSVSKNKKQIIIAVILLCLLVIFFVFLNKNNSKKYEFFRNFIEEMYNISYDEYKTMTEDKTANMETFFRRDKFEKFFTPKGFENFLSGRLSILYIHEVIENKCDVKLMSYTGNIKIEPYQFYYEYEADKFFYDYEVVVNVIPITNSTKKTKTEKGTISGYIIDDEYKIDSVKIHHQLFK